MRIPLAKLKALIRFFGTHTEHKFLGVTKMMKLFYFVDFMHVKKFGAPITFDTYIHLEHGQIPSTIMNLIEAVASDADHALLADTLAIDRPSGYEMKRIRCFSPFTEADERIFSRTELEVMHEVSQRFGDKNTGYIEDASHKEAPWERTELLQEIPYSLAVEDSDCLVDKEEIDLVLKI